MTQTTLNKEELIALAVKSTATVSWDKEYFYFNQDSLSKLATLIESKLSDAKPVKQLVSCEYCDGTGDVHRVDGEWLGECDCIKPKQSLAVPSGFRIVPIKPSDGHLKSMAIRYDHGLGIDGYYDTKPIQFGASHKQRLDSTISQMRQLYEEAIGEGFYQINAAPTPPRKRVDMTNDEVRKVFEARYNAVDLSKNHDGQYTNALVDAMWRGFKAAHVIQQSRIDALEKQWNYYQEFLKSNGFDGVTDILVKYKELEKSSLTLANNNDALEAKLAEVSKDAKIVEAAINLVIVKGRHNSEIAMNKLIEEIKKDKQ